MYLPYPGNCVHVILHGNMYSMCFKLKCSSFSFSRPLERAHITSLWASERHTLYKYTPLKGLWGSLPHAYTQTVQEVVLPLPLNPSNVFLWFYLIVDSIHTRQQMHRKVIWEERGTSNMHLFLTHQCFSVATFCLQDLKQWNSSVSTLCDGICVIWLSKPFLLF